MSACPYRPSPWTQPEAGRYECCLCFTEFDAADVVEVPGIDSGIEHMCIDCRRGQE